MTIQEFAHSVGFDLTPGHFAIVDAFSIGNPLTVVSTGRHCNTSHLVAILTLHEVIHGGQVYVDVYSATRLYSQKIREAMIGFMVRSGISWTMAGNQLWIYHPSTDTQRGVILHAADDPPANSRGAMSIMDGFAYFRDPGGHLLAATHIYPSIGRLLVLSVPTPDPDNYFNQLWHRSANHLSVPTWDGNPSLGDSFQLREETEHWGHIRYFDHGYGAVVPKTDR